MSNVPANLKYAASHEWMLLNADGTVTVGITDHAQEALGDLVFVELPEVGAHYDAEKEIAVVELASMVKENPLAAFVLPNAEIRVGSLAQRGSGLGRIDQLKAVVGGQFGSAVDQLEEINALCRR